MKRISLILEKYSSLDSEVVWLAEHAILLDKMINTPEIEDFSKGVIYEAAHQLGKWGEDDFNTYTHADWFWVVGYLSAKALENFKAGDSVKGQHHLITSAAVLAHWHARSKVDGKISERALPHNRELKSLFSSFI